MTLVERIREHRQRHNHSGVNHGAHSLAAEVLKMIAEEDRPAIVKTFDKCVDVLACYFHEGQDGYAAVHVLKTGIRPALLKSALSQAVETPTSSTS